MDIYFLGAGASHAGGLPVLKETLSFMLECPEIYNFLVKIFNVQKDQGKELLPSLDDVYSLIDFALFHDQNLGPFRQEELRSVRKKLNLSICRLFAQDSKQIDYQKAVKMYTTFAQQLSWDTSVVLSLNWDTALDFCLEKIMGWPLDYGVGEKQKKSYPLLKLHGSINWAWCDSCSQMTVVGYRFADWIRASCSVCGDRALHPMLIGPTTFPRHHYIPVEQIWQQALQYILRAKRLYFIGWSLDSIDLGALALVKRGLLLNKHNPQLYVLGHGLDGSYTREKLLSNSTVKGYLQFFGGKVKFKMDGFQGFIPCEEDFITID